MLYYSSGMLYFSLRKMRWEGTHISLQQKDGCYEKIMLTYSER